MYMYMFFTYTGVTASFGVNQIQKSDDLDTILKRCDDALYVAKDNGRNQVVFKNEL